MERTDNKVDMVAMNAAIEKVLAYRPPPKSEPERE